jgi:hypothetical protein
VSSVCVAVAECLDRTSHLIRILKTGVCLLAEFYSLPAHSSCSIIERKANCD